MVPIIEPSKLPNENATLAINCRFDSGSLESYFSSTSETANLVINAKTLFLYEDQHWFSWNTIVNAVPSPINNDAFARVYYTGTDVPRMTANDVATGTSTMPNISYKMGVKQPDRPAIISYSNNEQNDEGQEDDITRFYVQTFLNAYGEESMPSLNSEEVTLLNPSATVTILLGGAGTNRQNITRHRLYRTNGNSYQLVVDLPLSTTSYTDNLSDVELGIVLDTYTFAEPLETMKGLTVMSNGILAGFSGYTLCFSESFLPHAWPVEYQLTTEYEVVGIVAIGDSLVVGTTGNPYLFSGVSPDSISSLKMEVSQSCVSAQSMVDMGSFAMYASPDGLVAVGPGTAKVITKPLFNKKQWQKYQPDTIKAAFYEDKYIAFFGTGKGFIFDPQTLNFVELDFNVGALYSDLKRDKLYTSTNASLSSFDTSEGALTYTWQKEIRLDSRPAPAAIYIDTDDASKASFFYSVDGVSVLSVSDLSTMQDFQGELLFRLPPIRGRLMTLTFTGTARLNRIGLGSNLSEAKDG
jgi:hypothetical protein